MAKSPNWTREELVLAFNLYLKLPFGQMDENTDEVKMLSKILGRRTPGAVAMRLGNYAHIDPYHQGRGVVGLKNGIKQVQPIWDEFINNQEGLVFESERILADYKHTTLEDLYPDIVFDLEGLIGETKIRAVQVRVNQQVFRKMILKTYNGQCAISGVDIPELLVAGHIVPWLEDAKERLNPENGICLSNLYDKAYEKKLICIDTNYKLLISKRLKAESHKGFYEEFFGRFENKSLFIPKTYQPRKEFLEYRLNLFDK